MYENHGGCESRILQHMYSESHDAVFAIADFRSLGTYDAIRKALSRLTGDQMILRIVSGIYRLNPAHFEGVPLLPSSESVAYALARNNCWKILPGVELARHRIELTKNLPSVPQYLSTGPKTRVQYAPGHCLLFVHSSSKIFDSLTTDAAIVISALSDLDHHQITAEEVAHLSRTLSPATKEELLKALRFVPPRLRPIVELINGCYGRAGR